MRAASIRSCGPSAALEAILTSLPDRRINSGGSFHVVRGDVLCEDNEVRRLDDLLAEIGVEPPPYLEDTPHELEVDWED